MFYGIFLALITPFNNEVIDIKKLECLLSWYLNEGIHGIIPCGTTGETFLLSHKEQKTIIEVCISVTEKKIPVFAGICPRSLEEGKILIKQAEKAGADGLLVGVPPYIKLSQDGIYQYYKTINDNVGLPIILYNIPDRTSVNINIEILIKLAKLENIKAIKHAPKDLSSPIVLRNILGDNFYQFSGDDSTTIAFLAQGGHGGISGTANIIPGKILQLWKAWKKKDFHKIIELNKKLMPLYKILSVDSYPASVKFAVSLLGRCNEEVRKPLLSVTQEQKKLIRGVMEKLNIL